MGRNFSFWDFVIAGFVIGLISYLLMSHDARQRENAVRRAPPAQSQPVDLDDTI